MTYACRGHLVSSKRPLPTLTETAQKMSHHHGKRNLFSIWIMQVALRRGTSLRMSLFSMSHSERKRSHLGPKGRQVRHVPTDVPSILLVALRTNVRHRSSRRDSRWFLPRGKSGGCFGKP